MLNSDTRAWTEIDLTKIRHNVEEVQKLIPSTSKIMAIVKANAYGHGDVVCAKELKACGIDFFGVSSIDEAVSLREGGIDEEILILGYTPPKHFGLLAQYNILQTFVSLEYAKKLDAFAAKQGVRIRGHVKVDTGMSRIGIICQDHDYRIEDVKAVYHFEHLDVTGIFSHFSVSDYLDEENKNFTKHQIELFDRVLADLQAAGIEPGTKHLQNSYGILNYPDLAYDYVRPGLLWMGVTSDDAVEILTEPDFDPIMSWKANVSLVKEIQPGVSVSYGRHYIAKTPRKVATVAIGYADGFPRCVSNKGYRVLIHGEYAEIIGNVCMDQMMIDVTGIDNVKEGDIVTLVGKDHDKTVCIDELSRLANTINNETLCWISSRVPRIYK
ncbi:alanine racemase [[Eubacterium] hominis]|uniref:alanine racemase n=1 Tax=[Eubacterium] hominis TaxID=2764325 RepID=UPI003A4DB0FC